MALNEQDYDVYGVLFDVRVDGLDSVKGVVKGLTSTDELAKKVQGSLVNVQEVLGSMKDKGAAIEWIAKGGNDLMQFSRGAQVAAQQVKALGDRVAENAAKVNAMSLSPSDRQARERAFVEDLVRQAAAMREVARREEVALSRAAEQRRIQTGAPQRVERAPLLPHEAPVLSQILQTNPNNNLANFQARNNPLRRVAEELGAYKPEVSLRALNDEVGSRFATFLRTQVGQMLGSAGRVPETSGAARSEIARVSAQQNSAERQVADFIATLQRSAQAPVNNVLGQKLQSALGAYQRVTSAGGDASRDPEARLGSILSRVQNTYAKHEEQLRLAEAHAAQLEVAQVKMAESFSRMTGSVQPGLRTPRILEQYPRGFKPLDVVVDVEAMGSRKEIAPGQTHHKEFDQNQFRNLLEKNAYEQSPFYREHTNDAILQIAATGLPSFKRGQFAKPFQPGEGWTDSAGRFHPISNEIFSPKVIEKAEQLGTRPEHEVLSNFHSELQAAIDRKKQAGLGALQYGAWNAPWDIGLTTTGLYRSGPQGAQQVRDFHARNAGSLEMRAAEEPFLAFMALHAQLNPAEASKFLPPTAEGHLPQSISDFRRLPGWSLGNVAQASGVIQNRAALHLADTDAPAAQLTGNLYASMFNEAASQYAATGSVDFNAITSKHMGKTVDMVQLGSNVYGPKPVGAPQLKTREDTMTRGALQGVEVFDPKLRFANVESGRADVSRGYESEAAMARRVLVEKYHDFAEVYANAGERLNLTNKQYNQTIRGKRGVQTDVEGRPLGEDFQPMGGDDVDSLRRFELQGPKGRYGGGKGSAKATPTDEFRERSPEEDRALMQQRIAAQAAMRHIASTLYGPSASPEQAIAVMRQLEKVTRKVTTDEGTSLTVDPEAQIKRLYSRAILPERRNRADLAAREARLREVIERDSPGGYEPPILYPGQSPNPKLTGEARALRERAAQEVDSKPMTAEGRRISDFYDKVLGRIESSLNTRLARLPDGPNKDAQAYQLRQQADDLSERARLRQLNNIYASERGGQRAVQAQDQIDRSLASAKQEIAAARAQSESAAFKRRFGVSNIDQARASIDANAILSPGQRSARHNVLDKQYAEHLEEFNQDRQAADVRAERIKRMDQERKLRRVEEQERAKEAAQRKEDERREAAGLPKTPREQLLASSTSDPATAEIRDIRQKMARALDEIVAQTPVDAKIEQAYVERVRKINADLTAGVDKAHREITDQKQRDAKIGELEKQAGAQRTAAANDRMRQVYESESVRGKLSDVAKAARAEEDRTRAAHEERQQKRIVEDFASQFGKVARADLEDKLSADPRRTASQRSSDVESLNKLYDKYKAGGGRDYDPKVVAQEKFEEAKRVADERLAATREREAAAAARRAELQKASSEILGGGGGSAAEQLKEQIRVARERAKRTVEEGRNALDLGTAKGPLNFPRPYDDLDPTAARIARAKAQALDIVDISGTALGKLERGRVGGTLGMHGGNPFGPKANIDLIREEYYRKFGDGEADFQAAMGAYSAARGSNPFTPPTEYNAAHTRMMAQENRRRVGPDEIKAASVADIEKAAGIKERLLSAQRAKETSTTAAAEALTQAQQVGQDELVAKAVETKQRLERASAASQLRQIRLEKDLAGVEKSSAALTKKQGQIDQMPKSSPDRMVAQEELDKERTRLDNARVVISAQLESVIPNLKAQADQIKAKGAVVKTNAAGEIQLDQYGNPIMTGAAAEKYAKKYAPETGESVVKQKKLEEDTAASRERTNYKIDQLDRALGNRIETRRRDALGKEQDFNEKIYNSRAQFEQKSLADVDKLFNRKSATLQQTLQMYERVEQDGAMVVRPTARFAAERDRVERLQEGSGQILREFIPNQVTAPPTNTRSFSRLTGTVERINEGVARSRENVARTTSEERDRLAMLGMAAQTVAPEFRQRAQENLRAQEIRSQIKLTELVHEHGNVETRSNALTLKAHEEYNASLKREQEMLAHRNRGDVSNSLVNISLQLAAASAAVKGFVVNMVEYAARTETMKVVTEQMALVNGLSVDAVNNQITAIKNLRITTQDAHETVQRMIFAELDLAKATELARVAQDAAVISGKNSSETLTNIITGIVTGQTRILHMMGLQVSMQQVLRQLRSELGREPTEVERRQAMLNAVLNEGIKIQGNYEAAMLTAGKQMLSLKRQFQEAENAIGHEFQPAFTNVLDMMARFANFARENASEVALLTRAIASLAAGFLALKLSTGFVETVFGPKGFLSTTAKSVMPRALEVGGVAGAGEMALTGGIGTWLGKKMAARSAANAVAGAGIAAGEGATLAGGEVVAAEGAVAVGAVIPVLNLVLLATAALTALYVAAKSGGTPMSGAVDKVQAIKNQQDLDTRALEQQHLTGEIDDRGYNEAIARFYKQNQMLFNKAKQEVADVWIEQAKQGMLTSERFAQQLKTTKEQGFLKTLVTDFPLSDLWTAATWKFKDNEFKRAGFTIGEFLANKRVGGAKNPEDERKNMFARMEKEIVDAGEVMTAAGPVSAQENLKRFRAWKKKYEELANSRNDSLLNAELMLEQESANLSDRIQNDLNKAKAKMEALFERLIEKTITDPVEKVRAEMFSDLSKGDIRNSENFKSETRYLTLLGLTPDRPSAEYQTYANAKKAQENLGLKAEDIQIFNKISEARTESNPNMVQYGNKLMTLDRALAEYGLTGVAPKLKQYDSLKTTIDEFEKGRESKSRPWTAEELADAKKRGVTLDAGGKEIVSALPRRRGFKELYELQQETKEYDEANEERRQAYEAVIAQETMVRQQKYQAKDVDFGIARAQLYQAPGLESERSAIESTFQSKFQSEIAQHLQRNQQIRENVALQVKLKQLAEGNAAEAALANRLASEQLTTNEKLADLDRARVLAQEQINQKLRQSALNIDVGRLDDHLKIQEALIKAQNSGDSQRLEVARQIMDLEIAAADARSRKKGNDPSQDEEAIRAKDAAALAFELEKVAVAQSKVEKARNAAKDLLDFNFTKQDRLLKASAFGPLEEMSAARQAFELKKQQISALADFERKYNVEKKSAQEIDAEQSKQMHSAELEYLTQRMEIFKKQREEGQKMAGDVFNAMIAQGKGQHGLQDFFQGILKTTEGQVFKNAFGGLFTGLGSKLTVPGQGTADHPTFLGRLLQGTMFGIKDDPRADMNKYLSSHGSLADSNRELKTALDRLTQAISMRDAMTAPAMQAPMAYDYGSSPIGGYPSTRPYGWTVAQKVEPVGSPIPTALTESPLPELPMVPRPWVTYDNEYDPDTQGVYLGPGGGKAWPDLPGAAPNPVPKKLDPSEIFKGSTAKADANSPNPWLQNTHLPKGGSYLSANMRSWVGLMPDAYTKVGHVPLFTYQNPGANEAGEYTFGDKGIRLNTAAIQNGYEGEFIRHELTHKLTEPAIPALTQDKEIQGYLDKIRTGLVSEHGAALYGGQDGKPLPAENAVTEALAYNVQNGRVPGLNPAESKAFIDRAMIVAEKSKHQDVVDYYKRLQSPDGGEFTMKADSFKVNIPEVAPGQKGSQVAYLNNNPGNLNYDPANPAGAVPGTPHGNTNYAKFETPEAGYSAVEGYIKRHAAQGFTLEQYAKKYAEDPTYGAKISKALGVPLGTPLSAIDTGQLAQFQIGQESSSTVSGAPVGGAAGALTSPTAPKTSSPELEIPAPVPQYTPMAPTAPYRLPREGALQATAGLAGAVRGAPGSPINDVTAGLAAGANVAGILGKDPTNSELGHDATVAQGALRLGTMTGPGGVAGTLGQSTNILGTVVGGLKKNDQASFKKLSETPASELTPKQARQLAKMRKKLGISTGEVPSIAAEQGAINPADPNAFASDAGNPPPIDSAVAGGPDSSGTFSQPSAADAEGSKPGGSSMGSKVGTGMEIAAAGFMAYDAVKQFGKGGARGALGGAQDVLGIASMIPGPQQPFVMAAAMTAGMVKSLLGDPREKYKKEIEKRLKNAKYNEPSEIERTVNTSGQNVDFDFLGRVREGGMVQSGPLSSLTDVAYQNLLAANQGQRTSASPQPGTAGLMGGIRYSDTAVNTNSSGGNTSGPGNPVSLAINVNTMDSRSFNDNSHLIANAMRGQLLLNHPIANDIRQIAGA